MTKFKVGDLAGVGCMVDSCGYLRRAASAGVEQFCDNNDIVFTYNSPDKQIPARVTYGGYSTQIVVDEEILPPCLGEAGPRRCRAAALRRHHHLLAADATGRRSNKMKSASSAWAGSVTWA